MAEAARKFGTAEAPLYREAPNNIEAEQALLGAMLVGVLPFIFFWGLNKIFPVFKREDTLEKV